MYGKIKLRVFRNTKTNMAVVMEIASREEYKGFDFHILVNDSKIALVSHYLWEDCDYCYYEDNDDGVIYLN